MSIPVAPGAWPFLGHVPPMLRRRVGFTSSLTQYGDIVKIRLGPLRTYFLTDPDLVHRVLVTDAARFAKGAIFDRFRPFMGNGLVMSNGSFHRRQRRLVQPAFHGSRFTRYTETMRRATGELTGTWRSGGIRRVDQDMQHLAVTIVGRALFATELGQEAVAEARRSIPIVLKNGMIRALLPSALDRLPIPASRRFDQAVGRLRRIVLEVIESWRAEGADRGDLLSLLMLAEDEDTGETMSDEQVFDEVITLFTAGSETTAVALAWLFYELARHPEIEDRMRAEIDEVLGGRPITFEDVPKFEYTRRVIDEVLRMYPIWILMRRAMEEVDIGGRRLPAGTEFMFSPYSLHLDPRFHRDPHRFDPDRWLPERADAVPKGAFIPFSAGGRQCIGKSFAYTETIVVAATVLSQWRLVPAHTKPVRVTVTSAAYPSRMAMTVIRRR